MLCLSLLMRQSLLFTLLVYSCLWSSKEALLHEDPSLNYQLLKQCCLLDWLFLEGLLLLHHPQLILFLLLHMAQILKNFFSLPLGPIICAENKVVILHNSYHYL